MRPRGAPRRLARPLHLRNLRRGADHRGRRGAGGMTERVIAALSKNAAEELRVVLTEFHGRQLIDVRVYATYHSTGQLGPTKKGVTLRVELLPELLIALQQAKAVARARGLLP